MGVLPDRLPWFVVGPLLGLLVVGLYAVANKPLGATGAYAQVIAFMRGNPHTEVWRVWYFVGLISGGLVAALLRGGVHLGFEYGALATVLPLPALVVVLFVAGGLMGYGARWSGGCTSGHGLCGMSVISPGSLAATGTFMATAVAVTAILHVVSGGAL